MPSLLGGPFRLAFFPADGARFFARRRMKSEAKMPSGGVISTSTPRPLGCPDCKKPFPDWKRFGQHRLAVSTGVPRQIPCVHVWLSGARTGPQSDHWKQTTKPGSLSIAGAERRQAARHLGKLRRNRKLFFHHVQLPTAYPRRLLRKQHVFPVSRAALVPFFCVR